LFIDIGLFFYGFAGYLAKGTRRKRAKRVSFLVFSFILLVYMLRPFLHNDLVEAGVDEAGRGCYAGPVFAAAVILPKDFFHPLLNDSKQLNEKERDLLRPVIEKESIAFSVASVDNETIDKINILQASFTAMHLSLDKLKLRPQFLLIDGNRFRPYQEIPHQCVVKGDGTYASIAAASVLAKTYRDEFMQELHNSFPQYGWNKNKGYGTLFHRQAIEEYGLCDHHRKSFNIFSSTLID
jgi:ribonuclease HII